MKIEAQFAAKDGTLLFLKTGAVVRTDNFIAVDFDDAATTFADAREKFDALVAQAAPQNDPRGDDKLRNEKINTDNINILAIRIGYESVALSDGAYNEALLAALRNFIKDAEAHGFYAVIAPCFRETSTLGGAAQNGVFSHEAAERVIAAMAHVARRIKDCASVVGFVVPDALSDGDADLYVAEIGAKHAQYVYFSRTERRTRTSFIKYACIF